MTEYARGVAAERCRIKVIFDKHSEDCTIKAALDQVHREVFPVNGEGK